jgi:hypothetical protein
MQRGTTGALGLAKGGPQEIFQKFKNTKKKPKLVQSFWKLLKTFPVIKTITFDW